MDELISLFATQILPHWPFVSVTLILTIIGQFTSKSLFTKERAYLKGPYSFFWWWGRETLSLHPLVTGLFIGFLWSNPEDADPAWKPIASYFYFAGAGVVSLFAWAILRGILRKKGIDLDLFTPSDPTSSPSSTADSPSVEKDSPDA